MAYFVCKNKRLLIICNGFNKVRIIINEAPLEEQTKFIEILKYKKVSTFELPKNCLVIVTCSDLTTNKINEEVYSLLAQI